VRPRLLVALIAAATAAGVGIGAALALAHGRSAPVLAASPALHAQATWPAGAKRAPDFRLHDQAGRTMRLSAERGRVVLLAALRLTLARPIAAVVEDPAGIERNLARVDGSQRQKRLLP